jgi:hypothetical protein
MHTIEEIIADAQSAVAASLREAFDSGRHHQATEMREKFVAFFEGVIAPFSGAPAAAPAPAAEPPAPVAEAAAETTAEAAPADAPAEAAVAAETPAEVPPEATAEPASAA